MTRILHFIDSLSAWSGKAFAWCIVILTFSTCYEVFVRYVRGDVIYRLFSKKTQAKIDLVLYILFLMPGAVALIYYGYGFAADSWFYKEVSWSSPSRIQIYFFKTLIPISGMLVLLQGIAEAVRCIICIRTGEWPPRLHDVQETETMLMHEQEDLRKLEEEHHHV
jgi:TRAP-type mannitol/chloroaromatic compound transport system permease small subunit